jgi:pimeloyl-ACP methyl ester carboxylesterase
MGSSSRPPFECKTPLEADIYMIKTLEAWREEMGLENFFLAGHSYGGYLGGLYASTYPHFIRKLLLLSPLGLKPKPEKSGLKYMRYKKWKQSGRLSAYLQEKAWGSVSPFAIAR